MRRMTTDEIIKLIEANDLIKFYSSGKWKKLRLKALKRDCYECQMCKEKGKVTTDNLLVHHMKEVRDRPDLALVLENLMTVCFGCHEVIHDRFAEFNKNKQPAFYVEERW